MNWKSMLGEPETREKIIARWRSILADPDAIPIAKRMAHEALKNLHAVEARREPGQDDEEMFHVEHPEADHAT